ncbi:nitrile hydratase accessory protein [Mycolicibacterium iranicum]|uniref:Nitrile hydratase accessory protein n=1 Tax=Mycolicibacterium iranicum TaxID=912594 RepID=A0ABT4HBV0_MYCIR|nr:nitrile hydratase accessory protein [Mycolicibacterium iranicum]MCZ0727648.1 nitrile hydratase accessory protein [Mycolicibacterium iranicum]
MSAYATLDLSAFDALHSDAALPRSNGELVFDAPWQGRLFGLVVHMCKAGMFEWEEFKTHLIAAIGDSGVGETCDPGVYYRQFAEAFCRLSRDKGYFAEAELDERAIVEAQRLAHADHDHDHDHDH